MALTGRECGHQFRPDVRFCIVCGANRPEPAEQASAYEPTMVHQPASAYRARRLRGVLIGLATFLAAGGITAAVMLIAHPLHRGATPSPGGTPAASAPVSASSSPAAQPTQEAAAQGLAGLLAQSVMDLAALTSAWQNSIQADQDFAQWAKDEIASGCTSGNQSADPNARAAATPDAQATTAKRSFVAQWNPIAARYGLPAYRWNQL